KFQNTGTIDSVTIAFYGTFRASADKYLILSSDSSFASGNIWYPLSTVFIDGALHYQARVPVSNGMYMTYASKALHPGGVKGSSLWLHATAEEFSINHATAINNHNTSKSIWSNYGSGEDAFQLSST